MLNIQDLTVVTPDGTVLLAEIDLALENGRAVIRSGASGAGKSTLLRALFDADGMRAEGFGGHHGGTAGVERAGLVPQRGAPFDHLEVEGNLALALRAARPTQRRVARDRQRRLRCRGARSPCSRRSRGAMRRRSRV